MKTTVIAFVSCVVLAMSARPASAAVTVVNAGGVQNAPAVIRLADEVKAP
jgi:hypothetical protein